MMPSKPVDQQNLTISVIYDNYHSKGETKADWGFSCLIEGLEKTILFDTGTKSHIFCKNAEELKVKFSDIDALVISHNHMDHTGNITSVLKHTPAIPIYFPKSDTRDYLFENPTHKKNIIEVQGQKQLCEGLTLTGELPGRVWEQAIMIETRKGLVIVTGCAHPGIVNIVAKVREINGEPIFMVLGGFHLMRHSREDITVIINKLKAMGVQKCGPSHCTGDEAIEMFRSVYGKDFIELGTGTQIEIPT
jgi:7,8-dihydropterin-6-yl-methyl-4-(beta-D-ribofuranosyl)aminobenzene 5'-phosphate synthase